MVKLQAAAVVPGSAHTFMFCHKEGICRIGLQGQQMLEIVTEGAACTYSNAHLQISSMGNYKD
jgi:hypothetical protein